MKTWGFGFSQELVAGTIAGIVSVILLKQCSLDEANEELRAIKAAVTHEFEVVVTTNDSSADEKSRVYLVKSGPAPDRSIKIKDVPSLTANDEISSVFFQINRGIEHQQKFSTLECKPVPGQNEIELTYLLLQGDPSIRMHIHFYYKIKPRDK